MARLKRLLFGLIDNDALLKLLLLVLAFSATYTTWQVTGIGNAIVKLQQVNIHYPLYDRIPKRPCFSVYYDNADFPDVLNLWPKTKQSSMTFSVLKDYSPDGVKLSANFYRNFILKYNLTPFTIISAKNNTNVCPQLVKHDVPCIHFDVKDTDLDSIFSMVMLNLLQRSIEVLYFDIDIVFLHDPRPSWNSSVDDLHVFPSSDGRAYDLAIIRANPSKCSMELLYKVTERQRLLSEPSPHRVFNSVINFMKRHTEITIRQLDKRSFLSGQTYFEKQAHYFLRDNVFGAGVIAVLNNDVSSKANIYRLKESNLWRDDEDNYYTSSKRKYIAFENPIFFEGENNTRHLEEQSLRSALAIGQILNRTVILPEFHRYSMRCHLGCRYEVEAFDSVFHEQYREHSFLRHPDVPLSVKQSTSPWLLVDSSQACFDLLSLEDLNDTAIFVPVNRTHGATSQEVESWFAQYQSFSVLQFRCLYNTFWYFMDKDQDKKFEEKLAKGLYEINEVE